MPLLVDRSLTFGTLRLVKLALGCCQVLLCLNHAVPDENAYNHEHSIPMLGSLLFFQAFFSPPFRSARQWMRHFRESRPLFTACRGA